MNKFKGIDRIFALFLIFYALGCGVKGNPQPPDIPPYIGKGMGEVENLNSNESLTTEQNLKVQSEANSKLIKDSPKEEPNEDKNVKKVKK